jgi:hypothetical protein
VKTECVSVCNPPCSGTKPICFGWEDEALGPKRCVSEREKLLALLAKAEADIAKEGETLMKELLEMDFGPEIQPTEELLVVNSDGELVTMDEYLHGDKPGHPAFSEPRKKERTRPENYYD